MKILKGNYGECRFCDNMDTEHGLPSLEEKSWDLCLTDPPYNVKAKAHSQKRHNNPNWKTPEKIEYSDTIEDFPAFNLAWFSEAERISKGIIFTPGNTNLKWWYRNTDPRDFVIHYKSNGQGVTSLVYFNRVEFILVYGTFNRRFFENGFNIPILNGFMRKINWDHPHPKEKKLWKTLITNSDPQSVIDPFLGSGTTAEVCESLGIPWLGYEIMEEYAPDIEKRIKRGIKKKQQESLEAFL